MINNWWLFSRKYKILIIGFNRNFMQKSKVVKVKVDYNLMRMKLKLIFLFYDELMYF